MGEDANSISPLLDGRLETRGEDEEGEPTSVEDHSPPRINSRIRSSSECDVVQHVGNYFENTYILQESSPDSDISIASIHRKRWDLNYREAAIFLQEGENNDKFTAHPSSREHLPAYLITHNAWFYLLTLCASLLILSLAIFERPSVDNLSLPISIHASLELLGLTVIAVELVMKVKWLGIRAFIRHIRSMIVVVILVTMLVEAIIVMVRQTSHLRVTRALRPVFFLDSYYCRGVRRFIRQIIQALPPILDMLVLLLFFMLLFSMLGFYLFSNNKEDPYFQDIVQSFISLFILLTTANYPDVMMPAYNKSRWSAAFFVFYICIELFIFMNIFLAVVYSAFIKIEKEKLRKLLIHRRLACGSAFRLLVSAQSPDRISVRHFAGCMKYFRPRMSRKDVYLSFKTLNLTNNDGKLSEEEFMAVYDVTSLKWKKRMAAQEIWSSQFRPPLNKIFLGLHRFVSWKCFEYLVYIVIVGNLIWILIDTIRISVYCCEALLKILGFGPLTYFSSGWNIFDSIVTGIALLGVMFQLVDNTFYYIIVLRPLRVLRLFKLKRRFRDVFGTLLILWSRMVSLGIAMLLLYYFFAIIGMELFSSAPLANCCKNSSVEQYYSYNETGLPDGYYYLNNFNNIFVSAVTLFELTVVNNWWIIMEGYANAVTPWSRIFFMIFYLFVMIVITTIVAFILEAFIFRIQYRAQMKGQDMDDHAVRKVDLPLSSQELAMCQETTADTPDLSGAWIRSTETTSLNADTPPSQATGGSMDAARKLTWFRGEKFLSKNDFSLKMYSQEVHEWLASDTTLSETQRVYITFDSSPNIDDPTAAIVV